MRRSPITGDDRSAQAEDRYRKKLANDPAMAEERDRVYAEDARRDEAAKASEKEGF
jgi:hypothetical protein